MNKSKGLLSNPLLFSALKSVCWNWRLERATGSDRDLALNASPASSSNLICEHLLFYLGLYHFNPCGTESFQFNFCLPLFIVHRPIHCHTDYHSTPTTLITLFIWKGERERESQGESDRQISLVVPALNACKNQSQGLNLGLHAGGSDCRTELSTTGCAPVGTGEKDSNQSLTSPVASYLLDQYLPPLTLQCRPCKEPSLPNISQKGGRGGQKGRKRKGQ